jgi:hypothetical protein
VQDLQRDLAALGVNGSRDRSVLAGGGMGRQAPRERSGPALDVRRKATADDQAHAAARAFGEVGGQAREVLRVVLEARVHRAHQDPIA